MENIKAYLLEIRYIDGTINRKLEELDKLKSLAERVTRTYSDMPSAAYSSTSQTEDVIVKIIDLSNEINADIDRLVDMKAEVRQMIERLENPEYRNILSLRYLCEKTFEAIAVETGYTYQWVCVLHGRAVKSIRHNS